MELPNEIKVGILQKKIAAVEQEKYGLLVDHEVQTLVGNKKRIEDIEADLGNCVKVLKLLNEKLAELGAHVVECVNGKEPEHANLTE